ncbi:uncharacterized protein LOC123301446 [Chrysoperla carnea]|uniref:uncharacterized protein LOC123301446 n=1 Tax=Chrysoperla carnea TaxID=189513 RepID=UPI001D07354E|nr:uncharacterized protein LOC123301446 [Chrysoperla carnea]
MDQSSSYQCNSYEYDNSGYLTEVHSPFYGFPSETTSSNITNYEVSFNNKENVPVNNQMDLTYRNEITTLENSQKNNYDNQLLDSQGQVLSPFLGFENTCNQFSQPPVLSPYLGHQNNQIFHSQPPVLSPCLGSSQTFANTQTAPFIGYEAMNSGIEYFNQENAAEGLSEYQNTMSKLELVSENKTEFVNIPPNTPFVPVNQSSESELVSNICDNSERNSNINILDSSDNHILLQTSENLSVLKYLNDSEITNISFVPKTLESETRKTPFVSENQISESELVPYICDNSESNSNKNVLDTSDNRIVLQTPIKQVPENLNYDLILPLNPQRKDDNLSVLKYLNDSSESLNNLKTPATNEFISPAKSVLKSSAMKKSISFHPSTSVISNTGEETPSKYNESFSKNTSSDFSPEMFSDDENDSCLQNYVPSEVESDISRISTMNTRNKQDRLLLKRLQESFIGILPPPSVTICQLNADDILNKYNQNKEMFSVQKTCSNKDSESECLKSNKKSTMLINCDLSAAKDFKFPEIMTRRYHGLHYNRSKLSEDIEHLCQKYSERFIGNETSSSCTIWQQNVSSSASKRRMIRKQQQLCKSPGRRLSHLARRRITFSKENLNAKNSVLPSITMSNNQRMIGVKKNDILIKKRLSPNKKILSPRKRLMISPRKRKTPNKSPRKYITRTPTSSTKKRRRTTPSNENTTSTSFTLNNRTLSSKRALFQSPDSKSAASTSTSNIKRKLFAKSDNTSEDIACNRKRKRDLDDDDVTPQRDKFLRSFSSNDIAMDKNRSNFSRRNSETVTSSSADFSEHHTKKMLWAISTALRTQNIGMSHPNFKTYASVLSQICKRLLSDLLPGQTRLPGSVNERMSKIAHQHVYAVVKGKTVDEIVDEVKTKSILLSQKPKGYIAPDNFNLDGNNRRNTSILTTAAVETTENMNHLVINDHQKLDKSRIRRQIMFDK